MQVFAVDIACALSCYVKQERQLQEMIDAISQTQAYEKRVANLKAMLDSGATLDTAMASELHQSFNSDSKLSPAQLESNLASLKKRPDRLPFQETHHLHGIYESRRLKYPVIPALVGGNIPSPELKPEMYAMLVLLLYKPWRIMADLRPLGQTWTESLALWQASGTQPKWVTLHLRNLAAMREGQQQVALERKARREGKSDVKSTGATYDAAFNVHDDPVEGAGPIEDGYSSDTDLPNPDGDWFTHLSLKFTPQRLRARDIEYVETALDIAMTAGIIPNGLGDNNDPRDKDSVLERDLQEGRLKAVVASILYAGTLTVNYSSLPHVGVSRHAGKITSNSWKSRLGELKQQVCLYSTLCCLAEFPYCLSGDRKHHDGRWDEFAWQLGSKRAPACSTRQRRGCAYGYW